MDPVVARKTWRTLEPIHGVIYFAPEAEEEYTAVGLDPSPMSYFASRGAALGAVPAEVIIAAFFNFNPAIVRSAIPEAWNRASPATILDARLRAADRVLRGAWGDERVVSAEVVEAATLARTAAEAATSHVYGRPLFAAYAALPWPDEPHLELWHAQTLLREFRGDGHVAALLAAGLDPVEALVTHAASGDVPAGTLQATRAWPNRDWHAAVDRLRESGFLEPEEVAFTEAGARLRQDVEDTTDGLALVAYEELGEEGCTRLRALARPLSQAIVDGGMIKSRR